MLITLIRRELLDNLMTFRFAVAIFIMLLLVVANTAVLLKDYDKRLASYNTAVKKNRQELLETKTYSAGHISLNRAPNPLSIFNIGLDKRLGNEIWISYVYMPTLWDANKHGTDNPFLNLFTSIDLVLIFQSVLSLLALIFAYDSLAGEYERGTLRLVLTHPVGRGYILFAKYIGAMICLLVPLLMSILLSLILLTTSPSISLSTDDFLRIGGIVFTSLVYLSLFYLIGMLISAMTRRTSTALMLAMFVWGFLVPVYPNMILTAVETAPKIGTEASAYNQIKQIWEKHDREQKQFLANDAFPGDDWDFNLIGTGYSFWGGEDDPLTLHYYDYTGSHLETLEEKYELRVPHAQNYHHFLGTNIINTVERAWLIRKPALETIYLQPARIGRMLLKVSPVGLYDGATEAWAGTDLKSIQDFFSAAQRHRRAIVNHFYDKEIFASRKWFTADQGAVDWNTLPQFSFQRSDIGTNAKRALPDLFLLMMINIILFTIILLIFVKSEV